MKINESRPGSQIYFHTPTPQGKATFLYPLCLGHFYCDENYLVERNSYDSFLLMYIKKGHGFLTFPDHELTFSEGEVLLLDCYLPHTYGANGDTEFYWIHFDGIAARPYFQFLTAAGQFSFSLGLQHRKHLESLFIHMLAAFSGKYLLREIELGKYLTEMLTFLTPAVEEKTPSSHPEKMAGGTSLACEQAKDFMRLNFSAPLSLDAVAAQVSLSPYYFLRRFKELFGITPHQYLLTIRLDSARFYLRTTDRCIKDIAFTCGFQSENHFCIAFKKQAGMTPTCYRSDNIAN